MRAYLPYGLHPEVLAALAEAKVPYDRVTQGLGNALASRGYHLADGVLGGVPYTVAVDISTRGQTKPQVARVLQQLHQAGFAAWHRVPGVDGWPESEHDHIHAVYQRLPMKPSLQQQVADWHAGLSGLRDNRMTQEDRREVLDEYGPGAFLEPTRLAWPIHDQAHAAHAIAFMRMGRGDWRKFAGYLDKIKQRFPRSTSTASLWTKIQQLEQSWGRVNPRLSTGHSPTEFDQAELQRGVQVELEHTDDPAEATRIAMDHLTEHPHYYSILARVFPHERHNGQGRQSMHPSEFYRHNTNPPTTVYLPSADLPAVAMRDQQRFDQNTYQILWQRLDPDHIDRTFETMSWPGDRRQMHELGRRFVISTEPPAPGIIDVETGAEIKPVWLGLEDLDLLTRVIKAYMGTEQEAADGMRRYYAKKGIPAPSMKGYMRATDWYNAALASGIFHEAPVRTSQYSSRMMYHWPAFLAEHGAWAYPEPITSSEASRRFFIHRMGGVTPGQTRWNGRPSREELEARAYQQMLRWAKSYLEVTPLTAAGLARLAIRDPLAPITRVTPQYPYAHLPPGHWSAPEYHPRSEAEITQDMVNFLVEARETGHVASAPRGASPETARWKLR